MPWSTDWLYRLLLDCARATFVEAIQAANERGESLPKTLFATEHKQFNKEIPMPTGDPVRAWSSADDFASLLTEIPDFHTRNSKGGSIFAYPTTSWFIADDRKKVLICRWIGPRYGQGGWWKIVGQGTSGKLEPAEGGSWIS